VWTGNTDFHVTAQNIEKTEQSLGREAVQASFDNGGYLGLTDSENLPGFVLCQVAFLDDPLDMDRQHGFRQVGVGVLDPKIGEDIAAAFGDAIFGGALSFFRHGSHSVSVVCAPRSRF